MKYKVFFVSLFFSLQCFGQNGHQSVYLFSLDYLYPQKSFHQIESISKELWSDLDLLLTDDEAQKKLKENEFYVYQQCEKLYNAVNNLIVNETEARIYLTEDIEYLVGILEYIEDKYMQLAQSMSAMSETTKLSTYDIIQQAKSALQELLVNNQEVVLS